MGKAKIHASASSASSSTTSSSYATASTTPQPEDEMLDVLVVGAGLSGVDAGMHLSKECPNLRYLILEGRDSIGGTWDLFRYPGIRSDSDMFTLGYGMKPWTKCKALADGPSILRYIKEAAEEFQVDKHIRLKHRVVKAEWDSKDALWTVLVHRSSELHGEGAWQPVIFTTRFLFVCSGYYNYEHGYNPEFPGMDKFMGKLVHPQHWDPNLDYKDKQVVIIGSGATAVTLLPAMADTAAHVTMLQRSPTYIASLPGEDKIGKFLLTYLPAALAYMLVRWKNALLAVFFFFLARTFPNFMKRLLLKGVQRFLGKDEKTLETFTPRYNPWDQRLCFVPDGDLFRAIRKGKASVITGVIDTFTSTGVKLSSGQELPADVVVTATGLDLLALGGIKFIVDGTARNIGETISYRGVMLSGMPNMAYVLGYLNSSWTLKADLSCQFVARLLKEMRTRGARTVVATIDDKMEVMPWATNFSSGYLMRAINLFPKQGSIWPWKVNQNYIYDYISMKMSRLQDKHLKFNA